MAENMENQEVIDVTEATGLATTAAAAQTEPKTTKVGVVGKVCTVVSLVTGLGALIIKGYTKGKEKAKKSTSNEENVVDTEPTNSEDEVSE